MMLSDHVGAELVEEWGIGRRILQCKTHFATSAPGLAGSTRAHHTRRNLDTDRVLTSRKPSRRRAQGHPGSCSCVPAVSELVRALARVLAIPCFCRWARRAGESNQPPTLTSASNFQLRHLGPWHPQRKGGGGSVEVCVEKPR